MASLKKLSNLNTAGFGAVIALGLVLGAGFAEPSAEPSTVELRCYRNGHIQYGLEILVNGDMASITFFDQIRTPHSPTQRARKSFQQTYPQFVTFDVDDGVNHLMINQGLLDGSLQRALAMYGRSYEETYTCVVR